LAASGIVNIKLPVKLQAATASWLAAPGVLRRPGKLRLHSYVRRQVTFSFNAPGTCAAGDVVKLGFSAENRLVYDEGTGELVA
jgi:hypothetical protein